MNRDAIEVRVIQWDLENERTFVLGPMGRWTLVKPYQVMEPTLLIDGLLWMALQREKGQVPVLDDFVEMLSAAIDANPWVHETRVARAEPRRPWWRRVLNV